MMSRDGLCYAWMERCAFDEEILLRIHVLWPISLISTKFSNILITLHILQEQCKMTCHMSL